MCLARRHPRPVQHGSPRPAARARPPQRGRPRGRPRGSARAASSMPSRRFPRNSSASGCSTARDRVAGEGSRPARSPARARRSTPRRQTGRHARDPLHVGHDRAVEGRLCPHAQFYWWGVNTAAMLGIGAGRRALHLPSAVPHQRAQRVRAGAAPRRALRRRPALLRVGVLGRHRRGRGDRHLPPRRDGLDPRVARSRRPRSGSTACAITLAPATPAELHDRSASASGSSSSTATA